MLAGAFELVARAVMGFAVIPRYGFAAVCFANQSAWLSAFVFLVPTYLIVHSIVKKKIEQGKVRV